MENKNTVGNEGQRHFREALPEQRNISAEGTLPLREMPMPKPHNEPSRRCPKRTRVFQRHCPKHLRKRGQMEILGLAIVVVLLILGLVFVIKFVALKKPSTLKKEVVESQVASNYLSTYLSTSVQECSGLSTTELLQDCAAQGGITCQDGETSCEKPREVAAFIFNQTFDQWKWEYEMSAFLGERNSLFALGKTCPGQKRSKTFPLPTRAGTLYVKLDICG